MNIDYRVYSDPYKTGLFDLLVNISRDLSDPIIEVEQISLVSKVDNNTLIISSISSIKEFTSNPDYENSYNTYCIEYKDKLSIELNEYTYKDDWFLIDNENLNKIL